MIFSSFSIDPSHNNVMDFSCPPETEQYYRQTIEKADGYKHPPAFETRNVYSFPNMGGDAVSRGTHCPIPIA